jgi:hypothetical protein
MEKTKIVFCSSDNSDVNHEMLAYANTKNEIYIDIYNPDENNGYENQFICLDLITAIKFVKHLKKEIAIIKEMEVKNV